MGLFLNHSHFENFTRICQDITNEFKMCSSCLACEFEGNMDFISQEQTSKALIMKGPTEVKANDFHSPCQHFNFTVASIDDHLEEYKITCNLKTHMRKSVIMEDEPVKEKLINHTCGIMEYPNNCMHISLYLDVKNFTCSIKITWYVLVLLVFIFSLILVIHKLLKGHRRVWLWQSHKYKPTSVLLKGSDSEKLRALNIRVISETTHRLPLTQVEERLPPIPELEVASMVRQHDQYTCQIIVYLHITYYVESDDLEINGNLAYKRHKLSFKFC
ncbi:hypothetical protein MC885_009406 [Smutsia gigantea]|nr:hypothetical protein MC885_009406 [Smutsia gigantea]